MNEQTLNLKDIHLPEPISWWPLAPGWWILFISIVVIITALFFVIKLYRNKQLKRDIKAELESIKQQFQQSQNKSQLAKSLSALLRRASISYYPKTTFSGSRTAGLTGEHWLDFLDKTNRKTTENNVFKSDAGKVLLNAPYLPDDTENNKTLNFDALTLINLCESWLLAVHKKNSQVSPL
ncbi:FIG00657500: hypothetical protein [hydrothermal vent metagenome]|uniref:DUF4381 domain-containing protein n=1 Tax=hydrothermal vent metagenome TaxID=652676 RepID=A0A3B0X3W9_9ZZZZ